jgi:hypothetical protein
MKEKMEGSVPVNKGTESKLAKNFRIILGIIATAGFLFLFIKMAMIRFG